MELTRISQWYDRESGYIPQVGSDVILQPILAHEDWLNLRFMDHFGMSIEIYLSPLDVDRIIRFVTVQRYLKRTKGQGLPCLPGRHERSSDLLSSAFSEWVDEAGGETRDVDINVKLIDIKVKTHDHLSADIMNPKNKEKEYYILEFEAEDDGVGLDIVLSRIDANRIIFFEDARRCLLGGLK
jgi:hypothetical protein